MNCCACNLPMEFCVCDELPVIPEPIELYNPHNPEARKLMERIEEEYSFESFNKIIVVGDIKPYIITNEKEYVGGTIE